MVMDSFTHITSSSNLIRVVHLNLYPPIRCDCTLELFTRNIPRVNLAKSCIRSSRGARHSQLFTCWMEDYLSLRNTKETSNTSTKRYYYTPGTLLEGNVFSRVCLSTGLTWHHMDLFKPVHLENSLPPLHPAVLAPAHPGHVQTPSTWTLSYRGNHHNPQTSSNLHRLESRRLAYDWKAFLFLNNT